MKRWVAGIRAERRRKAMEEDFDSMYQRDHITSITVRERRSVVLCRVVGENAKSKEVCDDVAIDPVALLVLMTNNRLARDVASDLLDDHNGNVQHRNPFPCAALVFKNRLLGLANFLGGKMDPFFRILIFSYPPFRLV